MSLPMPNSWFGSKDDNEKPKDTPPVRHSTDLQRILTNPSEVQDESLAPARRTPPTGFSSPHDAVLAQMRGLPPVEATCDGLLRDSDILTAPQGQESLDGPTPTPVSYSTATHNPAGNIKEILHDPFDGTPLGLLNTQPAYVHLEYHPGSSSAGIAQSRVAEDGNKEEQWVHLSRVLELQSEVAKMHLEMEGIGTNDGKGKARGRGKGKGPAESSAREKREWGDVGGARDMRGKAKRSATTDTIDAGAQDGDEEGVDAAGDEEIETKRAREEQFANLADQFDGRKEAINEIMSKLDDLSKALTEFHTLQAPRFEFSKTSSRQNSTTPDQTPPLISSKLSATLPNAGLTKLRNSNLLHPVLPSIQGSGSSLDPVSTLPFERESKIIPTSLSRSPPHEKPKNATMSLIVNALEPGRQTYVMDSPDSMQGNVKLPPET